MTSNNASSADNQQERSEFIGWVIGYVDGEGCFSVSLIKNKTTKTGWQVFPEFVVTQGEKSVNTLEEIKSFFGCGNIFINRRKDNHKENIYRYCVRSRKDLIEKIIPFFSTHKLRSAKKDDFNKFVSIIKLMEKNCHQSLSGTKTIARTIATMNRRKKPKILESSETTR
jgi:hypothetical protein